ncbi:MAG TPA: hypothetical protein VH413_16190 [Verrucomicrobiae bacterium]|jgi:hypothetical protein|nr:hypothetical protein [Verrucomicrobiae bacterium]
MNDIPEQLFAAVILLAVLLVLLWPTKEKPRKHFTRDASKLRPGRQSDIVSREEVERSKIKHRKAYGRKRFWIR